MGVAELPALIALTTSTGRPMERATKYYAKDTRGIGIREDGAASDSMPNRSDMDFSTTSKPKADVAEHGAECGSFLFL